LNVVSDVYDFAIMATASSLREAMTSARRRLTPTAALALRSVASAFQSNIQGAISLLRRGLLNAPRDHEDSAYLRDMLLTLLASTGELDAAERLVGDGVALPRDTLQHSSHPVRCWRRPPETEPAAER